MSVLLFRSVRLARAAFAVLGFAAAGAASAGPLNPPAGPVAPTHKTLSEVEPRTPITSATTPGDATATYRIVEPGSYYLTGNLQGEPGKHGIMILATGVTLDLNGFTLAGQTGTLDGVHMPSFRSNVVVRNGHVRGWGGSGLTLRIDAGRVEGITATDNAGWGIDNTSSTYMTHIAGCEARNNGSGGIRGGPSSLISECITHFNSGPGIVVTSVSVVTGCSSRNDTGGIRAGDACTIRGNTIAAAATDNGHGIYVSGSGSRIEDNHVYGCIGGGIRAESGPNFIVRNSVRASNPNYSFIGSQTAGPIITTSGWIADTVSPWANFSF